MAIKWETHVGIVYVGATWNRPEPRCSFVTPAMIRTAEIRGLFTLQREYKNESERFLDTRQGYLWGHTCFVAAESMPKLLKNESVSFSVVCHTLEIVAVSLVPPWAGLGYR